MYAPLIFTFHSIIHLRLECGAQSSDCRPRIAPGAGTLHVCTTELRHESRPLSPDHISNLANIYLESLPVPAPFTPPPSTLSPRTGHRTTSTPFESPPLRHQPSSHVDPHSSIIPNHHPENRRQTPNANLELKYILSNLIGPSSIISIHVSLTKLPHQPMRFHHPTSTLGEQTPNANA